MAEVLTVSEAARELNKSAETIRDWADRGKLPAMRSGGGQRIFLRADVERVRREQRMDGDEAA